MASDKRQTQSSRFILRVTGLSIPDERRAEFEELVENLTDMADSLGHLDPLDDGLSVFFDPRV
jgi:hypothetical protein